MTFGVGRFFSGVQLDATGSAVFEMKRNGLVTPVDCYAEDGKIFLQSSGNWMMLINSSVSVKPSTDSRSARTEIFYAVGSSPEDENYYDGYFRGEVFPWREDERNLTVESSKHDLMTIGSPSPAPMVFSITASEWLNAYVSITVSLFKV